MSIQNPSPKKVFPKMPLAAARSVFHIALRGLLYIYVTFFKIKYKFVWRGERIFNRWKLRYFTKIQCSNTKTEVHLLQKTNGKQAYRRRNGRNDVKLRHNLQRLSFYTLNNGFARNHFMDIGKLYII